MGAPSLSDQIFAAFGLRVSNIRRVGGGDIADSYLLDTGGGPVFAKCLGGAEGLDMLQAEAEGLREIGQAKCLPVPEVLGVGALQSTACLLLEYIPSERGSESASEALGRGLARMHQVGAAAFGWHRDNYIGKLPQDNTQETDWPTFYASRRLMPQYEMALGHGLLTRAEVPAPGAVVRAVSAAVPEATPALLHGDLWSGNYLISEKGDPYLIDPATYYGHREVDLAMSLLFGGFPRRFYDAYFEVYPKAPGFEDRVKLYQLYYLLVHLNLFGRSYYSSVKTLGEVFFSP